MFCNDFFDFVLCPWILDAFVVWIETHFKDTKTDELLGFEDFARSGLNLWSLLLSHFDLCRFGTKVVFFINYLLNFGAFSSLKMCSLARAKLGLKVTFFGHICEKNSLRRIKCTPGCDVINHTLIVVEWCDTDCALMSRFSLFISYFRISVRSSNGKSRRILNLECTLPPYFPLALTSKK